MTLLQKQIIWHMLAGGTIAKYARYGYRLRDEESVVILKFHETTFRALKHLLRKRKDSLYLIDKNEVRKQRGNSWVKKSYKMINGKDSLGCMPF